MPTYSGFQFQQEWRFSLKEDFKTASGEPYRYADGGHRQWGDEEHKISFSEEGDDTNRIKHSISLSHDNKYLALSTGPEITIYSTEDYNAIKTLRGPADEIDAMAFRPGDSNFLVASTAHPLSRGAVPAEPLTFFWDLANYHPDPILEPPNFDRICLAAAKSVITEVETLSSSAISVSKNEESALAQSFSPGVRQLISEKIVGRSQALKGRIHQKFQGNCFSPSGHAMFYLPNGQRKSNDHDENWKLAVYSPDRHEDMYMLSGHTDSIMWTGYNHDESLIGTCGWDKSIRIWDASDGRQRCRFETEGQNWTGAFSPNGKYFLGTCGRGTAHVYNLQDGSEHMTIDNNKSWSRAVAWHPSSTFFGVGIRGGGQLSLINVNTKETFQQRVCDTNLIKSSADHHLRFMSSHLELSALHMVDGGKKIVFMVGADGSAEVYDIEKECKWRFARAGTENAPDNDDLVTSRSGYSLRVWEDKERNQVRIVTLDGDALRFWSLPRTG